MFQSGIEACEYLVTVFMDRDLYNAAAHIIFWCIIAYLWIDAILQDWDREIPSWVWPVQEVTIQS